MKRVRVATPAGLFVGLAHDEAQGRELATLAVDAARAQVVLAGPARLSETEVWLKGDHLPGSARARHSLRRLVGLEAPRVRELRNLEWLRARLFRVPRPLAALVLARGGLVRYQLLALEMLPQHVTLERALETAEPAERGAWIAELARETARLHALHFVHRDLFLRNVLVDRSPPRAEGDRRRLIFIDAWRGGSALPRRDASYDLACLMLAGADALSLDEQRAFVALYAAEREVHGRAVDVRALLAAADARRRELCARIAREPGRWRRAQPPQMEWRWSAIVGD